MKQFLVLIITVGMMLPLSVTAQEDDLSVTITSGELTHSFTVELADEPDEITRGLMERTELAPDAGMLFDFGQTRETNMWMKNVPIHLDMLFLAPDGTIVAIARNAVPMSERRINPGVPVRGVLEISGGRAAELGIMPGDKLNHRLFGADLG